MRTISLVVAFFIVPLLHAADPARDSKLEERIDKALTFLQNQQQRDGSWTSHGKASPGITALAVMAFLSAGHVPGEGPFGDTVEKGIRFVLQSQHANGLIASVGNQEMYHHGICTLMMAEVAGMTKGKLADEVRERLFKAVKVILTAQRPGEPKVGGGGWHYWVRQTRTADLSCTGWQLMALRASKNLGCDVPADAIDNAVK